jgi:hypothetical protein
MYDFLYGDVVLGSIDLNVTTSYVTFGGIVAGGSTYLPKKIMIGESSGGLLLGGTSPTFGGVGANLSLVYGGLLYGDYGDVGSSYGEEGGFIFGGTTKIIKIIDLVELAGGLAGGDQDTIRVLNLNDILGILAGGDLWHSATYSQLCKIAMEIRRARIEMELL